MAQDKRSTLPEGDDGRTIVNMNVEGMPWYVPEREDTAPGRQAEPMTKEESRRYTWAAVKAGLLVAFIFGAVFALFILFCCYVWLK